MHVGSRKQFALSICVIIITMCLENFYHLTFTIISGSVTAKGIKRTNNNRWLIICCDIRASCYSDSQELWAKLQHLPRPLKRIWVKSFEWDINSAQKMWKTQLTFSQGMQYNNINKSPSGPSENKLSLDRWKLWK